MNTEKKEMSVELNVSWIPFANQEKARAYFQELCNNDLVCFPVGMIERIVQLQFNQTDPEFRKERLKRVNEHPRDHRIVFDELPHKYYVDGEDIYTSVTTFNHHLFPSFNADKVAENCAKNKKYVHYGKTKQEILDIWEVNRVSASGLGTIMHQQIEWFYNGYDTIRTQPTESVSKELQFFMQYLQQYPHLEAYRTEWNVFDKELRLSGSIDMVYFNKATQTYNIYDWKRTKQIEFSYPGWQKKEYGYFPCVARLFNKNYYLYSLQLNVYKYILEKHYGLKITDMALVVLHPNHDAPQVIPVNDWSQSIIPDVIEFRKEMIKNGGRCPRPISEDERTRLLNDATLSTREIEMVWEDGMDLHDYLEREEEHEKLHPKKKEPAIHVLVTMKKRQFEEKEGDADEEEGSKRREVSMNSWLDL